MEDGREWGGGKLGDELFGDFGRVKGALGVHFGGGLELGLQQL
jgi:hypothetical protein